MDKYEYRVRAEEINALIEKREYAEAVKIADTIDWRRVKSVTMLCKVSELYKMNRRYEDSKEILLLAYDRQPGSRKIVYSLCELCIKLEELVQAIEYYKEFVQIAPKDTGRFILQYRLYEAQDVSLEERIAVLEEYKKRDYREKWAYELAYLYHRIGLATRCVEECDELILWFGEGKYVIKAMELKMLHVPLTPTQQEKYDKRFQSDANAYVVKTTEDQRSEAAAETAGEAQQTEEEQEKPGVSTDTIPSMPIQIKSVEVSNAPTTRIPSKDVNAEMEAAQIDESRTEEPQEDDELDIHVKTLDMGEYNTINLQKELAKNLAKIMEQEDMEASDATKTLPIDSINQATGDMGIEAESEPNEPEEAGEAEMFAENDAAEIPMEETEAISPEDVEESPQEYVTGQIEEEQVESSFDENMAAVQSEAIDEDTETIEEAEETAETGVSAPDIDEEISAQEGGQEESTAEAEETEADVNAAAAAATAEEEAQVDEQITGQLSFEDIMAEWEETKKANEAKHLEEMRRKVLEQTGPMFKDFDAAAKASVQADLNLIAPTLDVFDGQAPIEEEPIVPEMSDDILEDEEETLEESAEEANEADEIDEIDEAKTADEVETTDAAEDQAEPAFHPTVFNTAEINGLEEKLLSTLYEQESKEQEEEGLEEPELSFEAEAETSDAEPETDGFVFGIDTDDGVEELEEIEEETFSPIQAESFEEQAANTMTEEPIGQEIEAEKAQKPGAHTEEFDQSLEKLVMEALAETERKEPGLAKGDTGFIITDLTEEETHQEETPVPVAEEQPVVSEKKIPIRRTLTRDEKEMFGSIAQTKQVQEEVANAIDNVSLNPCIGNVLITGERGTGTLTVAKNLIKVLSVNDDNFSGKVAKITGELLNTKSIAETVNNLGNGALIVEQAGALDEMALLSLGECLKKKNDEGILILLEDTKKELDALLAKANMPKQYFDLRIDIAALDNDGLVNYGKEYANEQEYSIDDMGVLALYTRIADMQTNEHAVTVEEVKEIVDEAIRNSEKKNISHFMDVLLAKRYDDEDMIVLREKDFLK